MNFSIFRQRFSSLAACVLTIAIALVAAGAASAQEDGWINLLEGKDLNEHWTTKGNWILGDDGVVTLTPRNKETGPLRFDSYLWSKKQYKDFEVEFDYKHKNKNGLTAFFFNVADPRDPVNKGIHIRLWDHSSLAKGAKPSVPVAGTIFRGNSGAVPKQHFANPAGQWNSIRVTILDNNVTVVMNGETVNEISRDNILVRDQANTGLFGFQDYASPVEVRNLRVRVIKEERVAIALNTGGHTDSIAALAFAPGERLVTLQKDEVRLWSVKTGELERTWRMPARIFPAMAVSPDGKTVAVVRQLGAPWLWLLNLDDGGHRVIRDFPCGVSGLEFSADSKRVVYWGSASHLGVTDLPTGKHWLARVDPKAFGLNKAGTELFAATKPTAKDQIMIHRWDLDLPEDAKSPIALQPAPMPLEDSVAANGRVVRSPDGNRVVAWAKKNTIAPLELHFWTVDGKKERNADGKADRTITVPGFGSPWRMQFITADQLVVVAGSGGGCCLVNLKTDAVERRLKSGPKWTSSDQVALSKDGKYLAVTTYPGLQIIIYNLETGNEERRLDRPDGKPVNLSWGPDSPSIAWSMQGPSREVLSKKPATGLNLATLELLPAHRLDGFEPNFQPKEWSLKMETAKERKDGRPGCTWINNSERIESRWAMATTAPRSWSVARNLKGEPRIILPGSGFILIIDTKSGGLSHYRTAHPVHVLAGAPNGRYCLTSANSREIFLYRIDDKPVHLLTIVPLGNDWVAWTPQGYYAGTPGGERMIGVTMREDNFRPLTFYTIDRFRKKLYRPDVIKLLLEKGSVEEALKTANAAAGINETRDVKIDELLPPTAVLTVLDQTKLPLVKLKVQALASGKEQPITALRLMMDGRIVPGKETAVVYEDGKAKAEIEWTFELPDGDHQLSVMARCPDSSGFSPAVLVKNVNQAKLPALHVLTVGIDIYKDKALNLGCAAADAEELAAAFAKHCKGQPFGNVKTKVLLNQRATAKNIADQLDQWRTSKAIAQQDLVVVFFACHGVKDGKEYYLLTHEADIKNLKDTCLSGDTLRKKLGEFNCQVLLMLDACHSAGFGKGKTLEKFRPATDDVARDLTDNDCGVAVMCAAMGHEKAEGKGKHGLFTQAVLDALAKKPGVPFHPRSKRVYVHHLHTFVFDQVSDRSDERQHPFLSLPWVVESFVVR